MCTSSGSAHATKCLSHTHTDRHFPEIVKSCSGHPKMCKSIKNWKSKIFTKPMLSSIHIEENKKKTVRFYQGCILNVKDRLQKKIL